MYFEGFFLPNNFPLFFFFPDTGRNCRIAADEGFFNSYLLFQATPMAELLLTSANYDRSVDYYAES